MNTPPGSAVGDRSGLWFARRARNAARRSVLIAGIGSTAFVATVIVLAIVPRQRQAEARAIAALLVQRRDTAPLIGARDSARELLVATDAELEDARRLAIRPPPPPPRDTLSPALVARRDSLVRADAALTAMIDRARDVPLPATYRALGVIPELAGDEGVRMLLDSLAVIEREREAFGAVGGVDPVFVALTSRATAIGRAIQEIAERRRAAGRDELVRLRPPPAPPPVVVPLVDTTPIVQRRRIAVAAFDSLTVRLDEMRRHNDGINQRASAARTATNVVIPPIALLAAALIVAVGLGFGTALTVEVRDPRIADADEAGALAGLRVLATVGGTTRQPERSRRQVDREMSPLIDTGSDAYRLVYLFIAGADPRAPLALITGPDRLVTTTIAVNVAVAAAYEARTTLLVDGDASNSATTILRVRERPGLADVLAGAAAWTEAIVPAVVGRDRLLDVLPRGGDDAFPRPATISMREQLGHIARRYDLVLVSAPAQSDQLPEEDILPTSDVIYCIVAGVTRVADLRSHVEALRDAGARMRGIVIWDGPPLESGHAPERLATTAREATLPLSTVRRDR